MPIYEYRCTKCEHRFEKYSPGQCGDGSPACPRCGKKSTEKVFSLFASQCGSSPGGAPSAGGCGSGGFS